MSPIRKLVFYSLAMIVLPLATYFMSNHILANVTTDHWANIYAAVISVVVIHFVLFAFVYQAYNEDRSTEKRELEEKKTD